uniref:Rab GTPase-binding effector protein 1 n=1 Tax=Schistosoma japonicum TaxID=6182 RepID=C1L505_SCHJA|nr:Rab GTPase-binding effector protein 1 [Schistosoma japonicum]
MLSHNLDYKQSSVRESFLDNTAGNFTRPPLPAFISDILDQLTDNELKNRLGSAFRDKESELLESQSAYKHAQNEVIESKKQLAKLELELANIKSAAEMLMIEHDDALSCLKKQYDEELSSLLIASEQGYLHQFVDDEHSNNPTPYSATTENETCSTPKSSFITVEKKSAQSLANQAFDKVERLIRRVSHHKALTNNFILNKTGVSSFWANNPEVCSNKEEEQTEDGNDDDDYVRSIVEPYETEISRLQQILVNAAIPFTATSHPNSLNRKLTDEKIANKILHDSNTKIDISGNDDDCNNINVVDDGSSLNNFIDRSCDKKTENHSVHESSFSNNDHLDINENYENIQPVIVKQSICDHSLSFEGQSSITDTVEKLEKKLATVTNELNLKTQALKVSTDRQLELENALKTQVSEQISKTEKISTLANQLAQRLDGLLLNYKAYRETTEREISNLLVERKIADTNLQIIRSHYDSLVGRRSQAAAELSRQPIQLPNEKDELEHLALKLYEENLSFREARDHLEERLNKESEAHKEQLANEQQERLNFESSALQELEDARQRLANLSNIATERDNESILRQKYEEELKSSKSKLNEVQAKYELTETSLIEAQKRIVDLQDQIVRLQNDLDNIESVQADFVRLSQNLQVQLERLRQQDHEVRWINPDDVTACFACNSSFSTGLGSANAKKINCRHCGKVHCSNCMKNSVPAGPFGHPAVVCDVCHTLLNKNIAPYFSTSLSNNNNPKDQLLSSTKRYSLSSPTQSLTNLTTRPS